MNVYIAVAEDYTVWVAETMRQLLEVIEDDCGGRLDWREGTHHVTIEGAHNSRETVGWRMSWNDSAGDYFMIYVYKREVEQCYHN